MYGCCCCSVAKSLTPWTEACQASLPFTTSQEFAQIHVYLVSDGNQPSHPLLSPSPPALNFSQQVGSSHQVVKVLELQLLQMYKTSK